MGQDFETWFLLALGLAAAGLLPVKLPRRGSWGVSLALSLLWGWLAVAAASASPDSGGIWAYSWTFLATLQALAFLISGVLTDQLRFEARNGFWTVIGTLLLLYSLVVFPLLGRFEPFHASAFGAPFPLVLFTCGVLLFTVDTADRIVSLILVVPLLWALAGGPEGTTLPEIWGLRAVLLTGTWFALLPPEFRGGGPRRASSGEEYRVAYRGRAYFGYGLWAVLLITLFLILASGARVLGPDRLDRFTTNLALLSALGLVLWLAFPAWQSLWFRYVAWGMARAGGRIWGWLKSSWKWALLLLAALALVTVLDLEQLNGKEGSTNPRINKVIKFLEDPGIEDLAILLLSAAVLLWLIYLAYQGRNRLVIEDFADRTGEDGWKDWVAGLGPRLQNELGRIADLYKVIDEARPSQKSAVIQATPSVQDVGDILRQTSGGSIDFKIVKIPADFIFQLISRVVSGPRLRGALHKGNNELSLTAEISGGGRLEGNWHVDTSKLTEEERRLPEKEIIYKLVEHLSFRVATHLVDTGSPRWQAVRCFTDGLRFYRETQRSKKDFSRNLREAERCFIRALNDDQKFTQCHYNLGVVYRQLGEFGSAESAFRRALEEDPEDYESYYALAETFAQMPNFAKAVWFCEAAIRVDPKDSRAWDLKAYAHRRHMQELDNLEEHQKSLMPGEANDLGSLKSLSPDDSRWEEILQIREIAVALAWRRLCTRELRGAATPADRDTAFLCLRNFAVVLTRVMDNNQSTRLFQQASWLAPQNPDLRLNEGKNRFWQEENPDLVLEPSDEPMTVLQGVFDDGLEPRDRGFLWSTVAHVLARSAKDDGALLHAARLAQNRFLDLIGTASSEELGQILKLGLEDPPERQDTPREGNSMIPLVFAQREATHNPTWSRIDQDQRELRRLGFGPQRTAKACRERLQRLCQFLLALDQESGSGEFGKSTLRRLKKTFEAAENRDTSRKRRILRLEDLCRSLGRAVRSEKERASREIPKTYFYCKRWAPPFGEKEIEDQKRREFLEKGLTTLKFLPQVSSKPQILTLFEELLPVLEVPGQDSIAALEDLVRSFDDCVGDWEWAYLQVLIRLALLLLEEEPGRPDILKQAAGLLEEAIERLEDKELLQARRQGLYGTLAGTYVRLAQADLQANAEERQQFLHKALTYAQHAVELEPESIRERCKLLEVLSALGDYEEMKAEADIALDLDSSSETLKVVGKCFWSRIAALRDRKERRSVLKEAVRFFRNALTHIESDPFDNKTPMEQVQAHGWAHFWLGRFLCERGGHDEGAVHLGTARSLGFKPLESRVELAWAYLLGGSPEAEQAFREAIEKADRQSTREPLGAAGEERPIAELKLDARLGLAFLWADRDPGRAGRELAEAWKIAPRPESGQFRAVVHEVQGRIALKEGGLKRAVEEVEQSLDILPRSSAFCALASAKLQQARSNEKDRDNALRQAREAWQLARSHDVRGRYHREIRDLLRQLRQLEEPNGSAAKPPSKPAPKPAEKAAENPSSPS